MVGAINPNETQTIGNQSIWARQATIMLQPGEPWPAESSSTDTGTATTTVISTQPTASNGTSIAHPKHERHRVTLYAVLGVGISSVLLTIFLVLCWRRRNKRIQNMPTAVARPRLRYHNPARPGEKARLLFLVPKRFRRETCPPVELSTEK